ncbi:MAG: hypothetical protein LBV59_13995 [Sphingobacterium sp.]|jgi:hypothetical protein|uniref:hypothetical protein n=1 Tax=unclassified Sphingobacterium TaxID=2609468 RepID=UPI002844D393|nr:hypothetical protein [Sphingobacterium sp.]MDR3009047.1 hypothetical protein [Sphingobacterium sp.]
MLKSIIISSFLLSTPSVHEHTFYSFLEGNWTATDAKLKSITFNKNGDAFFTFSNSNPQSPQTSIHQKVDSIAILNRKKFSGYFFSPNLFGKYNDNKTAFEIEIKSANEIILFVNKQEIQLIKNKPVTQFK